MIWVDARSIAASVQHALVAGYFTAFKQIRHPMSAYLSSLSATFKNNPSISATGYFSEPRPAAVCRAACF
jgi:hypothetical protein